MKRLLALAVALFPAAASAIPPVPAENKYMQSVFVANKAKYKPSFATDPAFINAWGIAIRPAGKGGHFWITAKDVSYEYVGDVKNSPEEKLRMLHQDELKTVKLPVGGDDKFATSTVFSASAEHFKIIQKPAKAEPITAPAKFLFASDGGIISAWTERKKPDGKFDWPAEAITVIDQSKEGAQFFGLAISKAYDRLYAADFGAKPGIKVFNGMFHSEDIPFGQPFDDNKNGKVDAGEYAPFNIQQLITPSGESHIFVAYAKTQACPEDEVKKGSCKKGEIFAGEEDTSKPGYGRIAEFTESGKLVATWNDGGKLSAPWGMAYAPADFGKLSGALLVANFGSGTISAFDPATRNFVDVVRSKDGKPLVTDKIWGLLFGNGEHLGDANALYFTAGPEDEADGMWGVIRTAQ